MNSTKSTKPSKSLIARMRNYHDQLQTFIKQGEAEFILKPTLTTDTSIKKYTYTPTYKRKQALLFELHRVKRWLDEV